MLRWENVDIETNGVYSTVCRLLVFTARSRRVVDWGQYGPLCCFDGDGIMMEARDPKSGGS
jgi:hypothetical protein